jgi:predicted O-methyltransferase YrrM
MARAAYHRAHPFRPSLGRIDAVFVEDLFDSEAEYRRYANEFEETGAADHFRDAKAEHERVTDLGSFGSVGVTVGEKYYALVRKYAPDIVVETGVCNGFSTYCILLGLEQNDGGKLHSIDYPFHESDALAEFRGETYDEFGGATVPDGRDPGWIIPDELSDRWDLRQGRTQRELPRLVNDLDTIDCFFHDSEHSVPCMLFEFELAWEWLADDGVLIVDDYDWNDALEVFADTRGGDPGLLSPSIAYLRRDQR